MKNEKQNGMQAGTVVKINKHGLEFAGRLAEVCFSEPCIKISPYSGTAYESRMVRLTDEGRFQGRSFELNSECLEVVE